MGVKRWLLKRVPDPMKWVQSSAILGPLRPWLAHAELWSLQRRKVAMAVAVGMFAGLMPGPTQMLAAAALALLLRINLPIAMMCTLYTNPFTYLPLYLLAYELGKLLLGVSDGAVLPPWPAFTPHDPTQWQQAVLDWVLQLGWPLLVGVPALGLSLAILAYGIVMLVWRCAVVRQWQKRKGRRGSHRKEAGR